MLSDGKVRPEHLDRGAYLYVRQSTLKQVVENTESTERQYALRGRAVALGWRDEQLTVIDRDLGMSAASVADREGFQQLVTDVGLGRAGIVMGLEVSRLARRSSDWHRLVEICALRRTLILDEDGLYDPGDFNDRLLLGLKGTMSEAELHFLRARLNGGRMNAVRRGELRVRLPVGLVYDGQGRVALDPDRQVQQALRTFFDTYRRVGTVHGTVRTFREQGLKFPTRLHFGPRKGELVWETLKTSRAFQALQNPRYAGAYAHGRRQQHAVDAEGRVVLKHEPREKWHTLILGAHPGYLSWEQYEENLARMRENARATPQTRRCPPREGPALLQGLVMCGRCGGRMTVRYTGSETARLRPHYVCKGSASDSGPRCQSMPGDGIDEAVGALVMEAMAPAVVEVAFAVQEEVQARIEEVDRLRSQQVERARYESELARQRFMQVDPNNRLVADTLEAEWNEKLRALQEARDECERRRESDRLQLDATTKARIHEIVSDVPRLWQDPRTAPRERKRIVRLLIEDVTLNKAEEIDVHVRFRGGSTRSMVVTRPRRSWESWQLSREIVTQIDRLLDSHTYEEVATILNERRLRSGQGKTFDGRRINVIRRAYGLRSRHARLRARGLLTLRELASRLGVCTDTIKLRRREGRLPARSHRVDDNDRYMYEPPDPDGKGKGGVV